MDFEPLFLYIDLFAGWGGTTLGVEEAELPDDIYTRYSQYRVGPDFVRTGFHRVAKVIACVNHDPKAIKSHWLNHPDVKHFEEDIRTLDLTELIKLVDEYKAKYPKALVILWASLECTNFSKAKGGQSRDADSRTLADHLIRYIEALKPDYIQIENVVEFMAWGPMRIKAKKIHKDRCDLTIRTDKKTKEKVYHFTPISSRRGEDWMRWKSLVCSLGYRDEWTELNSADYGAYTSRNRLFGIFAKPGLPICFPEPTHQRKAQQPTLFETLPKWKPVKDVLDFNNYGRSIINRKKKLAKRTVEGIMKGIEKFIASGDSTFLYHYYGKSCQTSIDEPCSTLRTKQSAFLVYAFLHNPSWGQRQVSSIHDPAPTYIARQDKAPLRVVNVKKGGKAVRIIRKDPKHYKALKEMMQKYSITDIFFRPLTIQEGLLIHTFPETYQAEGNIEDLQRFLGNSVVPIVAKSWTEALASNVIRGRYIRMDFDETNSKVA